MSEDISLLVQRLPSTHKVLSLIPALPKPHVVVHSCNISIVENVGRNEKFVFILGFSEYDAGLDLSGEKRKETTV